MTQFDSTASNDDAGYLASPLSAIAIALSQLALTQAAILERLPLPIKPAVSGSGNVTLDISPESPSSAGSLTIVSSPAALADTTKTLDVLADIVPASLPVADSAAPSDSVVPPVASDVAALQPAAAAPIVSDVTVSVASNDVPSASTVASDIVAPPPTAAVPTTAGPVASDIAAPTPPVTAPIISLTPAVPIAAAPVVAAPVVAAAIAGPPTGSPIAGPSNASTHSMHPSAIHPDQLARTLATMPEPADGRWYLISAGKFPGVYANWDEAGPLVNKVSGAIYKKHSSRWDALAGYVRAWNAGDIIFK